MSIFSIVNFWVFKNKLSKFNKYYSRGVAASCENVTQAAFSCRCVRGDELRTLRVGTWTWMDADNPLPPRRHFRGSWKCWNKRNRCEACERGRDDRKSSGSGGGGNVEVRSPRFSFVLLFFVFRLTYLRAQLL